MNWKIAVVVPSAIAVIGLGLCGLGVIALSIDRSTGSARGMGTPAPYDAQSVDAPAPPSVNAAYGFGEGDWVVGVDIDAGTYRTAQPVDRMCYWGIYRAGTNKGTIVANDIVTGGRPSVTLKGGQEFSSSGCGEWVKS